MLATMPYVREAALAYAARWALSRNPLFYNFTEVGGDCTNFVSQAVLAGSCVMNMTPTFGWYYRSVEERAPAFTGVQPFWDFFTGAPDFAEANGGVGPFGREVTAEEVLPGDVVQLGNAAGTYYHTLLITRIREREILVAAHSNDAYDRPLSSYQAALRRYLHVEGVRFAVAAAPCARDLIAGVSLPQ